MLSRPHVAAPRTALLAVLLVAWAAFGPWPGGFGGMDRPTAGATDALCPVLAPLEPCALEFSAQPADAEKETVIRSVAFDPQAPGVQVRVVDFLGQPVLHSDAEIKVELKNDPTTKATLEGGEAKKATDGVATFDNLTIDLNGFGYTLKATSPGLKPAESTAFDIWGDVAECAANEKCQGSLDEPGRMSASVTGTSSTGGFLLTALGAAPLDCGDTFNHAPSVVTVDVVNFDGPKTVVMTISKEVDQAQANNGVSFYQVCYESPDPFKDRNGATVTKGLLPDCAPAPQTPVPPCVESKVKKGNGSVEVTVLLPAGDPHMA